jgi:hypothetical protein
MGGENDFRLKLLIKVFAFVCKVFSSQKGKADFLLARTKLGPDFCREMS